MFNARNTIHVSHNLSSLLVAEDFHSQHISNCIDVTVTFWVDLFYSNYHHVVVFTTFIQWRNFAFVSFENPLQSFASVLNTTYIVFVVAEVCTFQQTITAFFCVFNQLIQCSVLSYELAEFIVSLVVCFLAEFYRTLDHCNLIFILNSLLVQYLKNNVYLTQFKVSQFVLLTIDQSLDILSIVCIQCSTFVVASSHPSAFACLAVDFSNLSEFCTTLQCCIDAVCQSLCLVCCFSINLNLAELDRVCNSFLSHNLHSIV